MKEIQGVDYSKIIPVLIKNDETTGVESRSKQINAIQISLYFRHTRPIVAHATKIVKGDNKTGNSL